MHGWADTSSRGSAQRRFCVQQGAGGCMTGKKIVWMIVAVAAAVALGLWLRVHRVRSISVRQSVPIEGAVVEREADPNKELPIADVAITASDGVDSASTRSDASGYFKLVLHRRVLSD